MKRSVILVHPPQQGLLEGFSSGIIALANYLALRAPNEADVRILDLGLASGGEIASSVSDAVLQTTGDLIVGITTTTATYRSALRVAWDFKQAAPECTVVLGGHHAAPERRVILEHHRYEVDAIAIGEGEVTLLELVRHFPDLGAVRGLAYRGTSGEIVENAGAPLLSTSELDQLEAEFHGGGIRSKRGKFDHVTYVSARGCPLGCHFCSVANRQIRAKSVSRVASDLRHLVVVRGVERVALEDNFFAHSPIRTIELCREIARLQDELVEPFRWDCQTRVESMRRPEVLAALEQARCEAVYLGVEALDGPSLLYLGKTPDPSGYLAMLHDDVVPRLLASPVECYINLQLGLPGETAANRENTLAALRQLGASARSHRKDITVFPMLHVVYPGTRHFEDAIGERRFEPFGRAVFEDFTAWEETKAPVRRWLGEHFAHGTGGIPEAIINHPQLHDGDWNVDGDAVLTIQQQLREMATIDGISVFDYSQYLTGNEKSDLRDNVVALPNTLAR